MEPLFKFHFWQTVSVLCLKSFFPPRWLTIKFGVPSFETDISSFLIQLSPQQPPQIPTSVTSVRNKNFNCCDPTCPFVHLKHSASCKNRVCKHPKKTDVHLFPIDFPTKTDPFWTRSTLGTPKNGAPSDPIRLCFRRREQQDRLWSAGLLSCFCGSRFMLNHVKPQKGGCPKMVVPPNSPKHLFWDCPLQIHISTIHFGVSPFIETSLPRMCHISTFKLV